VGKWLPNYHFAILPFCHSFINKVLAGEYQILKGVKTMTKWTYIKILIVGLLSVFVIGVAQAVEVGPLGYWPFEDGSGKVATDKTGNGHDADIVGAKWIKDGKFGKALDFDGNSHVDIPQSDEMSS